MMMFEFDRNGRRVEIEISNMYIHSHQIARQPNISLGSLSSKQIINDRSQRNFKYVIEKGKLALVDPED